MRAIAVVVFHETVGKFLGVSAVERKTLDVLDRLGPSSNCEIARHTGPQQEVTARVFGALRGDLRDLAAAYDPAQLAVTADFQRRTTDVLRQHISKIAKVAWPNHLVFGRDAGTARGLAANTCAQTIAPPVNCGCRASAPASM